MSIQRKAAVQIQASNFMPTPAKLRLRVVELHRKQERSSPVFTAFANHRGAVLLRIAEQSVYIRRVPNARTSVVEIVDLLAGHHLCERVKVTRQHHSLGCADLALHLRTIPGT